MSLRDKSADEWEKCYTHPFVQELGAGTLNLDSFKFYLVQDYIYLIHYAKIYAAAVFKASDEVTMTRLSSMQHAILKDEMHIHRLYMSDFGISAEEAGSAKQSLLNKVYTANMISVAAIGGIAEIIATILPCAWSYYDFATRLKSDFAGSMEGNLYRAWIDGYSGGGYYSSFEWMFAELDRMCENKSQSELDRITDIFHTSVEFEYLFWEMSYKRQMTY
jgi:thiaminase/transcriptional activator TenA